MKKTCAGSPPGWALSLDCRFHDALVRTSLAFELGVPLSVGRPSIINCCRRRRCKLDGERAGQR